MQVAIHQPNYFPWLGYFAKISQADVFVFLDDCQFSKGGYTNRVKIRDGWLTVPVHVHLGDKINEVYPLAFVEGHLKRIERVYDLSVSELFDYLCGPISIFNRYLVERCCSLMGISCEFVSSSELGIEGSGAVRLAAIVRELGGDVYLSGAGGQNYQTQADFGEIELRYSDFRTDRKLSVLDTVAEVGWEGAGSLSRH